MSKSTLASLAVIAMALVGADIAQSAPVRFAQTPEISPDGREIAFSYAGDLWVVGAEGGEARRLTDHVAHDSDPVWSPDGSKIAFASDRLGNFDVYVISARGGDPTQVSFHSNTDRPCDWTADGDGILFESRRRGSEDLWLGDPSGGMPIRVTGVTREREAFASLSSDGKKLLYNDNRCTTGWQRRFFNSSDAAEIHIADYSLSGIRPERLTNNEVHDLWPHFSPDGSKIYFASARSKIMNIFRMNIAGDGVEQLTTLDHDVNWLSLSRDSDLLVYSSGFEVWTMPLAGGPPTRVEIEVTSEPKKSLVEAKKFTGDVSEFRISPDGKKAVIVVHGEVFVVAAEKGGPARRITDTPWRERDVQWLSDSRRVVYTSDRNGSTDLYISDTKTVEETQLTSGPENDGKPTPSPDGESIAFYRDRDAIWTIDPDGGNARELIRADFLDLRVMSPQNFSWSSDSRWIAYSAYAPDFHVDIRVHNVDDGTDEVVSFLARDNSRPIWSPDGEFLYFTSLFHDDADNYRIRLKAKKPEFKEDILDSLYAEDEEKDDKKEDDDEKGDDGDGNDPVVIDFDRIDQRMAPFPSLPTNEYLPVFDEDGDLVIFLASILGSGKYDIWSYPTRDDAEDKKLSQLTTSGKRKGGLQVVDDMVWYLEGGAVKSVGVDGNKKESLSFEAMVRVDVEADRRQMFEEGWALLADQFYDPDYHGVSWSDIHDKYEAVLPHVRTRTEFQTLMRMMLGELNASHLNYSAAGGTFASTTGELGVELDWPLLADRGEYRVASVLADSPADNPESKINAGEYLIAVDGISLSKETNLFQILEHKIGKRVTVDVAESAGGRNLRSVKLRPISRNAIVQLQYEHWVDERRALVDEWSDGRLAYLHVQSMGGRNLERFRRELVTLAEDKDGVLVDVRYNGGGSIAVHLLGILERKPFLWRNFVGGPFVSETKSRSYGYEKPAACLINNHSYSNAEIFAEGFRKLGLGPVVGIPTAGAVIGTNNMTLLDGSTFRKPSWGAYTLDGENLENIGRKPDFHVENSYTDWMEGADPQLAKAVEELLKTLEEEK